MKPLISVIVPIYNAERFLPKCLDSIIGQTYEDLDIILIDDGSTDSCGAICEEYVRSGQRIRVFHRRNSGLVASRAFGLSHAKGEYILWVDSDDWIESDMCDRMAKVALAGDCDMVWCDVCGVMNDGLKNVTINYTDDAEEMVRRIFRGEVPAWLWNKLIKRTFYDSANMKLFPADSMMEDTLQSIELLCANPKMGYVNQPLYYYNRMNESAMTANHQGDVMLKGINNIKHTYDYLVEKGLFGKYSSDFAYLAMRAKLALLLASDIKAARALFPYAHKLAYAYKMQYPVKMIYWLGFNGGALGQWLISAYLTMYKGKENLLSV